MFEKLGYCLSYYPLLPCINFIGCRIALTGLLHWRTWVWFSPSLYHSFYVVCIRWPLISPVISAACLLIWLFFIILSWIWSSLIITHRVWLKLGLQIYLLYLNSCTFFCKCFLYSFLFFFHFSVSLHFLVMLSSYVTSNCDYLIGLTLWGVLFSVVIAFSTYWSLFSIRC